MRPLKIRPIVLVCVLVLCCAVAALLGRNTVSYAPCVVVTPAPTSAPTHRNATVPASVLAEARRRWGSAVPSGEHGVPQLQRLLGVAADARDAALDTHRLVIDVGGNVGQTTSHLMQVLVRAHPTLAVLTFEPMNAYEHIVARARDERWNASLFGVFQCAVGARPAQVTFYFDSDTSEQSSQDAEASGTRRYTRNVTLISMDQLFYEGLPDAVVRHGTAAPLLQRLTQYDVYFWKIDTEGYDAEVLGGAARLLREKRVRFIEFEYNSKWFSLGRNRTLRDVTRDLYARYAYECYFVHARHLHPLFGAWWDDAMEIRLWSNVFCGRRGDRLLHWIVRRVDAQDWGPLAPVDTIEEDE